MTEAEDELVRSAAEFATLCHQGQTRKGGRRPYIVHPEDVVRRLRLHGVDSVATICAAWLHDVMEDCGVPKSVLVERFGQKIADIVEEVTHDNALSKPDRVEALLKKAPTLSAQAKLIKLADKTSNLVDIVKHPPGWRLDSIHGYKTGAVELAVAMRASGASARGLIGDLADAVSEIDRTYRKTVP